LQRIAVRIGNDDGNAAAQRFRLIVAVNKRLQAEIEFILVWQRGKIFCPAAGASGAASTSFKETSAVASSVLPR
jgi:hypothetical protein